ncbi:hypothetical protein EDC01DRAFT_292888 [Geopyxis carbonaria]|nr:hypothetical protein EDC01DRAFT_292888 [Geopyxis carbonaria]
MRLVFLWGPLQIHIELGLGGLVSAWVAFAKSRKKFVDDAACPVGPCFFTCTLMGINFHGSVFLLLVLSSYLSSSFGFFCYSLLARLGSTMGHRLGHFFPGVFFRFSWA